MSIFLIRHGQTASNAARVVQTPETPLSEKGEAQARRLAQRLAGMGVAQILSSDLERAHGTARQIREATGAPLELEPLLQERNFGDYRGTAYANLPGDIFAPGYAPPGGETWSEFHRRVDLGWERVRAVVAATKGHTAVVTHGLVCHSIVARFLNLAEAIARPGRDGPPLPIANTALTVIEAMPPWTVERLACTAHLEGDASLL